MQTHGRGLQAHGLLSSLPAVTSGCAPRTHPQLWWSRRRRTARSGRQSCHRVGEKVLLAWGSAGLACSGVWKHGNRHHMLHKLLVWLASMVARRRWSIASGRPAAFKCSHEEEEVVGQTPLPPRSNEYCSMLRGAIGRNFRLVVPMKNHSNALLSTSLGGLQRGCPTAARGAGKRHVH